MNTTKTLLLAAFATVSLGLGSAMAQEGGGPSMPTVDFWMSKALVARQAPLPGASQVQAGSADVEAPRAAGAIAPRIDFTTLASPG